MCVLKNVYQVALRKITLSMRATMTKKLTEITENVHSNKKHKIEISIPKIPWLILKIFKQ